MLANGIISLPALMHGVAFPNYGTKHRQSYLSAFFVRCQPRRIINDRGNPDSALANQDNP